MTGNGEEAPFIFIVAGEPSGDALGGALIRALRERTGGRVRVAGIGGESMAEQGFASLVPLSDLAVAGIAEVLPRAPLILRRVRETVQAIRQLRPDAVVTIDSSGFSWRIAHRLRRHGDDRSGAAGRPGCGSLGAARRRRGPARSEYPINCEYHKGALRSP